MKLLITRHDKIGDFILTLPLFKAIKEQYKGIKITALVSKINFEFAKNIEFIDDVILFDKKSLKNTLKQIKSKKFDASISAYIDITLGKLLFKSGIKRRIAPSTKIAQIFFNEKVKQRRSKVEKTEWKYNMELGLKLFPNITLDFSKPLLSLNGKKEKKVVFHAGSGGSSDGNLTLDDYINLANSINNSEYEIVFTFGPDDKKVKEYISKNINFNVTLFDSKISLYEFAYFLNSCYLFVSTSTGPMHLAGAVNIKTLSFFGSSLFSSFNRWATINHKENQNNFMIEKNYSRRVYKNIENRLKELVNE